LDRTPPTQRWAVDGRSLLPGDVAASVHSGTAPPDDAAVVALTFVGGAASGLVMVILKRALIATLAVQLLG
jgi:hypothetical protein